MKTWANPTIEELNIENTFYGSKEVTKFDSVYVNAEGYYEATFQS